MQEEQVANRLFPLKRTLGLLDPTPLPSTPTIFIVPDKLRRLKDDAYNPQIVSIGPYHSRNRNLQDMEAHKVHYVLHLLHRTGDPVRTLHDCGNAIHELENRVRACYAKDINPFLETGKDLLEILLVDGCFIIELFYRQVIEQDTSLNDPIANNPWMLSSLRHDLVLLENQIPFFVIQQLYDNIKKQPQPSPRFNIPRDHSLTSLALSFFYPEMDVKQEMIPPDPYHLLELLHKFCLPKSDQSRSGSETQGFDRCASDLIKAGIQFKMNNSLHLLDIKFNSNNGVIEIPPLSIDAESLLRNLIALEQCDFSHSPSKTCHVTSYALMMRSLIRSSVDAKLLQKKGIITSDLERSGNVLGLIQGICKNVVFSKNFYFDELCKDVNEYRGSRCHWQRQKAIWTFRYHRYFAELKRDYFSSPWKVIAFLAGLVLLILTGLQTFYTVRSYYPH